MTNETTRAEAVLANCPFCGVPLSIRKAINLFGDCDTAGCWAHERKVSVNLDDPRQVDSWNRRKASPPVQPPEPVAMGVSIPEGYALVPIEPTEGMRKAVGWPFKGYMFPYQVKSEIMRMWKAMIAASPTPQPEAQASGFAEGVEAAAKVAETYAANEPAYSGLKSLSAFIAAGEDIATAIRALKPVEAAADTSHITWHSHADWMERALSDEGWQPDRANYRTAMHHLRQNEKTTRETIAENVALQAQSPKAPASEVEREAHWLIERRCSPSL